MPVTGDKIAICVIDIDDVGAGVGSGEGREYYQCKNKEVAAGFSLRNLFYAIFDSISNYMVNSL